MTTKTSGAARVSCLQVLNPTAPSAARTLCQKEVTVEDLRSLGLRSAVVDTLINNQFISWRKTQPNFLSCAHANCGNGVLFEGLEEGHNVMTCPGACL